MKCLISGIAAAFVLPVCAADLNGYTARYECRAGNTNCDVDVVAIVNRPCQQIITPATTPINDWSAINFSNDVICIGAGDHSGRGTLMINVSGNTAARKVLRYYRVGDSDDEPWQQTDTNQTKIKRIFFNGADFWILHRLTLRAANHNGLGDYLIEFAANNPSTDNILNRLLVEGRTSVPSTANHLYGGIGGGEVSNNGAERLTVQNSVVRNNYPAGGGYNCVGLPPQGTDVRIVNNEIYDWCEHNVQHGNNNIPTLPGLVIENNDIYQNPPFNGYKETAGIVMKASGTPTGPYRIIHNRIWGARPGNGGLCCEGGGGSSISLAGQDHPPYHKARYVLLQNNIIFDGTLGISGYPGHSSNASAIGNLFYGIRLYNGNVGEHGNVFSIWGIGTESEHYLNTVIASDVPFDIQNTGNHDLRCNAVIASGASIGPLGAGTQASRNMYYASPSLGETDALSRSVSLRANSAAYSAGAVVRSSANPQGDCLTAADSACFLYQATIGGVSAATAPGWCTTLGCTVNDGGVIWQAIRGPYTFYRKLRTGPQAYTIPYARVHMSAPEARACPAALGSRPGMGVNDNLVVP